MISLSALNPQTGIVRLQHIYRPTAGVLKPHNLHALHRLGYQTEWSIDGTETVETAILRVPPRRSVYRDLAEQEVGTVFDWYAEPTLWVHEWSLVARKVLNPYTNVPNAFEAAELVFHNERLGVHGGAAFRNLNCVGSFKGPYSPTLE